MTTSNEFDIKALTWDTPEKTARAQEIAEKITVQLKPENGTTALEYGCGTGLVSLLLKDRFNRITAADSSKGMLAALEKKLLDTDISNIQPQFLDLTAKKLEKSQFSVIYTAMALHHIPDTLEIMKTFAELLNQGGQLFIADLSSINKPGADGQFINYPVFLMSADK